MRRSQGNEPQLITSAPESNDHEYDQRRKKYAIMMSIRTICVVLAAVAYQVSPWLSVALLVGGMVLPWPAVLIANNGPVKKRAPAPRFDAGYTSERALTAGDKARTVDG